MIDLNALRMFEKVATLRSFSGAARALGVPKSNVSRLVSKLETDLGVRLFQRTTRDVTMTPAGTALLDRCAEVFASVDGVVDYVGSMGTAPRGLLKISAGIGFGINVLAEQLPEFLRRYPQIDIALDLESRQADLVAEGIDVAVRMGPMPDSGLVAIKLGEMRRYCCASSDYLARNGTPASIAELEEHDTIDMPGPSGRPRPWVFSGAGGSVKQEVSPRVCVNEALTAQRLIIHGAGIGMLSGYICGPEIKGGRLVRLFSEYQIAPVEVSIVFPSRRKLAPAVRAFADYMKEVSRPGRLWQDDPL